jgi:hypothetical protein
MGATMEKLGIDQLSPAERVAVALEIWERLWEARPQTPLTPDQQTELAPRMWNWTPTPGWPSVGNRFVRVLNNGPERVAGVLTGRWR